LVLRVWFLLVVNTSASDCLERIVLEMIYYVFRGTLNSALLTSLAGLRHQSAHTVPAEKEMVNCLLVIQPEWAAERQCYFGEFTDITVHIRITQT